MDASAAVEWVLGTEAGRAVRGQLDGIQTVHVPEIWTLECAQALRRPVLRGEIDAGRASELLDLILAFGAVRHRHGPFVRRTWTLRHNITAYDGAYVALAEALSVPLLTCDEKLAGASGHQAELVHVPRS